MGFPIIGHKLIVTPFFPWKIIRAIIHEIEHVKKGFPVVTYSTIYIGHIQHNDDAIIVEVTMTRQKFQKLLYIRKLTNTEVLVDILRDFRFFSSINMMSLSL